MAMSPAHTHTVAGLAAALRAGVITAHVVALEAGISPGRVLR